MMSLSLNLKISNVFVIMFLILYSSIFDLNLLSYDFNLKDDIPPIPIAYYMKNQWHDGNFWFSYVKNDRTSFYEEARSDSSLLKVFHKYEVVTAILRKRVKDEVWILVGTYDPSGNYLIYGWIKEDQIIIKSDFKPVDKFEYKSIIISSKKDGNIFEFYFNREGQLEYIFSQYEADKITGKIKEEPYFSIKLKGRVKKYKDIYWFATDAYTEKERNYESDFLVKFHNNKILNFDDIDDSNPYDAQYVLFSDVSK